MKILLSWLKDFIDINIPVEELCAALTMAGLEVTGADAAGLDDYLLDIEVTPNRPDCLSILGIAREAALILDLKFKHPKVIFLPKTSTAYIKETDFDINIEDGDACPRYIGRILLNVTVGPAPEFIKDRLAKMAVRSVNNVVDITNYILLERGQPMHVFDYDKIQGKQIVVRFAKKGERLLTIDQSEINLDEKDLVIADAKRPVALAGIMGGLETEVGPKTSNIILESASFNPSLIRATARRHGMMTEASYRFERGVDFPAVDSASKYALELFRQYACPQDKGRDIVIDKAKDVIKKQTPLSSKVVFKLQDIERSLGTLPSSFWIRKSIKGLGCEILSVAKDRIKVQAPSYRRDLNTPADYIEEIARLYGYDKIPYKELPCLALERELSIKELGDWDFDNRVKECLSRIGLREIISYALVSEQETAKFHFDNIAALDNPLTKTYAVLRPSMLPSILKIFQHNFNRSNYDLALFELGKIYFYDNGPIERKAVVVGFSGSKYKDCFGSSLGYNFFDLKSALSVLTGRFGLDRYAVTDEENQFFSKNCSAAVWANNQKLAVCGKISESVMEFYELKKELYIAEIYLDVLKYFSKKDICYQRLPQYPAIERDIALILPQSVSSQDVVEKINNRNELVSSIEIVDVYQGKQIPPDKKGLAIRITYRSLDRTLKDDEVDKIESDLKNILIGELSCQIRE
ncbi:MAG: phenylalanine--tRNA ligase subunit beta [Candidatus Omnitrophica bacterium]|nr:phenylalanine--tRNA ligase subunit beta [Candidatus Omnitrophota bacterium]